MVRIKYRYFLVEFVGEDFLNPSSTEKLAINSGDVYRALYHAVRDIHGEYGLGVTQNGLNIKMLNPITRIMYLRVRRGPHVFLASSLPFVTQVGSVKCTLRTLHLAGSIRSCHKFLRKYEIQQLASLIQKCSTDEERQAVQQAILASRSEFLSKVMEEG